MDAQVQIISEKGKELSVDNQNIFPVQQSKHYMVNSELTSH